MTFGQAIRERRKSRNIQLKDLAARVIREDKQPISFQYLSDLEHDRRPAPSDHIIDELARELKLSRSYLYLLARRLPSDFTPPSSENAADAAYEALLDTVESFAA